MNPKGSGRGGREEKWRNAGWKKGEMTDDIREYSLFKV